MSIKLDADVIIIFLLPIIFVVFLLIPNNEVALFGSCLTIALLFYELITFKQRTIYGLSGLRIVSFPSLILLTFTIFIAAPSIYIMSIKTHPAKYTYFISIIAFYILYPIGLLIANFFKKIDLGKVERIKQSKFEESIYDLISYKFLLILFLVCVSIFLIYLTRTKVFPLFELIKHPGSYLELKFMREEALKLLDVTFLEKYLFNWLRSLFFPFGIVGSLFLTITYKKKKYIILFFLFFGLGLFINTLTLEKSPSAAIFLSIMTLFFLKQKRFNIKYILFSILIVFSIPSLIVFFMDFGREDMFTVVLTAVLHRIFIIPSESVYQYFRIFPNIHEFLYGRGTRLFSWLFDEGQFPVNNYMAKVVWKNPNTTGFMNANFIGNYWINFEWIGIILSCFIIGIIVHLFYWKLLKVSNYKKNIIFITIVSSIIPIFSICFISENFTSLFFTRGLVIIIMLLIFIPFLKINPNTGNIK